MSENQPSIALRFEKDAYHIDRKELMGRHVAGNSFIRAVLNDIIESNGKVFAHTNSAEGYRFFEELVESLAPNTSKGQVRLDQHDALSNIGTLHLPDPNLPYISSMRLRGQVNGYSITGVTHTTASHTAMDMIRALATSPVMPWDALICTSYSVKHTVETVLNAEFEYLRWRLGAGAPVWQCKLPVIPLGLHAEDFKRTYGERVTARNILKSGPEEIVFMFIGRLNPFVKANPIAMYIALQKVAERTKRKITLIECGWFHADEVRDMQFKARQEVAPNVRHVHVDGRKERDKNASWAAADVFISLSDNIQETFGLTPVEAMAAGKPVIVSDWDGYKELVEDGVQGFRIPTTLSDETESYASAFESGSTYGRYCAGLSQSTEVNIAVLVDRIEKLVENDTLRKEMGENGRNRAKSVYDWSVVYPQYKTLWRELKEIREHFSVQDSNKSIFEKQPKALPSRLSPSELFETYPTQFLTNSSVVKQVEGKTIEDYRKMAKLALLNVTMFKLPTDTEVQPLFNGEAMGIAKIATDTGNTTFWVKRVVGTLLKWGLFEIVEKDQS